jgi:type I restriction enzyme, S subunit
LSELPNGWATERLGEICDVVRGITFPSSAKQMTHIASNICCLRTTNIQRLVEWHNVYFVPREYVKRDEQFVQLGDILMSMANSYELVGKVAVVQQVPYPTAFGAFLSAVRPQTNVHGQYLFHLLRTEQVQSELRKGSSQTVNIANISVRTLSDIQIPLAPLNEQKRIADKLDALLARVDACRERLDRVPLILKRFRQAVLAAATSGQLTEDWREDRSCSSEWQATTFGSSGAVTGGLTKNPKRSVFVMRKPYMRVANVYANRLELDDVAEIGLSEAELTKTRLVNGDLLIVEGNGSVDQIGRAAIWNGEIDDCAHQNHIIRWRSGGFILPKFALFWLLSPQGRSSLVEVASSTTGLHTLSISKVSAIPVRMPTLAEQKEIVRRVEALFTFSNRLEARYKTACNQVEQLTPALLAKAFRGELVPQNPNDEPATVLLERIRAARAVAEEDRAKSRRRKTDKPSKAEVIVSKRKNAQPLHLPDVLTTHDPLTAEALFSASQLELNIDDSAV